MKPIPLIFTLLSVFILGGICSFALFVFLPYRGYPLRSDIYYDYKEQSFGFSLKNITNKEIRNTIDHSFLSINGRLYFNWHSMIGNGPIDDRWKILPGGESIGRSWLLENAIKRNDGFPSSGFHFFTLYVPDAPPATKLIYCGPNN